MGFLARVWSLLERKSRYHIAPPHHELQLHCPKLSPVAQSRVCLSQALPTLHYLLYKRISVPPTCPESHIAMRGAEDKITNRRAIPIVFPTHRKCPPERFPLVIQGRPGDGDLNNSNRHELFLLADGEQKVTVEDDGRKSFLPIILCSLQNCY